MRSYPTAEAAAAAERGAEERWQQLSGTYPLCPGVTRAARPTAPTAGDLATTFWGEIPLPKPEPRIEPGYAITGKRAFLETGGVVHQPFTRDTPLGTLTLAATGRFTVDWGDGTVTGPHDFVGEPWPDGRITHVYERTATVTVTVTEEWTATWQLAGQSGTLDALRTEAVIAEFPIHEIQAVRNR